MGGTAIFRCNENCVMYSRSMSRVGFSGFWSMPKFLINMYNVCQTPETRARSRKSTQTLISEGQCMMKWVEPAFENQKSQRGRIGDSCLGPFIFFDDAWLRSRAIMCRWYDMRDMYIDAHLVAPHPHKSHYDAPPASGGRCTTSPELVRLHFREPR